jgi:hypothetical protein
MAEKDGSTHQGPPSVSATGSAPGARDRRAAQPWPLNDKKLRVVHVHEDRERNSTMEPQRPAQGGKWGAGMLDRSLQAQLGRQLRAIFSDVANEPVPERFVKLLEALEAKEKRQ